MKIKCRHIQKLMGKALYETLEPKAEKEFARHLETCEACRTLYDGLKKTAGILHARKLRAPDPCFWESYWDSLAPRLSRNARMKKPFQSARKWLHARVLVRRNTLRLVPALSLVAIGIVIGKLIWSPGFDSAHSAGEMAIISGTHIGSIRERTEYTLEKSKVLFLAWANFDPESDDAETLNLPFQKQMSQLLVQETGFLKSRMHANADRRMLELLTDLEVVLLQIANLEDDYDLNAVSLVKSGLEKRSVLFKINVSQISSESRNTAGSFQQPADKEKSTI